MSDKECPKCGLTIFVKDGVEIWTCIHNPNPPKKISVRRNKMIAVEDLLAGDYCDPYTLGHIFATGRIEFTVPSHAADAFHDNYYSIKDKDVPEKASVYYNDHDRKEKRWFSSRVTFDKDENVKINTSFKVYDNETGTKFIVSMNDFTWYLLNMGMDVNGENDPDIAYEIFDNDEDRDEFLRGFAGVK